MSRRVPVNNTASQCVRSGVGTNPSFALPFTLNVMPAPDLAMKAIATRSLSALCWAPNVFTSLLGTNGNGESDIRYPQCPAILYMITGCWPPTKTTFIQPPSYPPQGQALDLAYRTGSL